MTQIWIASQTVGSGGAASVTFSNIPQTFTHLQLRGTSSNSNSVDINIRLNGVSTSIYSWHLLAGNGATASSANQVSVAQGYVGYADAGTNPASYIVDILDYTNTNKNRVVRTMFGRDNNGSGNVIFSSSLLNSTSAVTSLTVFPGAGTFNQNSRFDLYGIQTASATGA